MLAKGIGKKYCQILHSSALDPQDFGFLDPDPKKYADPRSGSKGENINQKLQMKNWSWLAPFFLFNTLNPKIYLYFP